MHKTHHKTAKERMRELRQLYLRQQRTQAEAKLLLVGAYAHLQVAALSHLMDPETMPCPADAPELLHKINQDADYVVAYNVIREGYHPLAVAEALHSHMCDLDYPQSQEYVKQIISRAQTALNKEPVLAVG